MTTLKNPHTEPVLDDIIQPFQLDSSNLRGRLVRLSDVSTAILAAHAYPPVVAQLLGEALALAAALSAFLKYDGMFTLQTSGDGPVKMLACDITRTGNLRGCAQVDAEALTALLHSLPADASPTLPQLLGRGYLAFTVDQGPETERYQGIVLLDGASLADCIHFYFEQSEQIRAAVRLACRETAPGIWRAGALILQQLPPVAPLSEIHLPTGDDRTESWERALHLLATCTDAELTDGDLSAELLLYRLFHAEEIRVYDSHPVQAQCRCSAARVRGVLTGMSLVELEALAEDDGQIHAVCEFCKTDYLFDPHDLQSA
jgi:molecular chaperone Hsp33